MPRPLEVAGAALAAFGLAFAGSRPVRANGAFPESYQIVLPADHPQQIILATNFGLIISDDDGATWTWTCESKATQNGSLYSVAAPPLDRLYSASTLVGLAWSDDGSCTWTSAGGSLTSVLATDYFSDPTNTMRVYAFGQLANDDTSPYRVVASDDGGKTFGDPLFMAPAGLSLSGVESARADPRTIYVASYVTAGFHPRLQKSIDGGATWTEIDVEPSFGANAFHIIAVDPNDANVVTARVIEPTGDSLAISRDGGMTFTKMFTIAGSLTSYVRLDSGTILVAGALAVDGVGFRSTDGGMTFTDWAPTTTSDAGVPDVGGDGGAPRPPHIRALAARGGKLYAAAKNFTDDWALGVSTDEGVTFARLMRYDQVASIRPCAQATCLESCEAQAGAQVWPPSVCHDDSPPPPPPPAKKKGCGCAVEPGGEASGGALPAALAALAALCLARGRRRR
jgi:MYXO-CTERM domain-containing protein